MAKTSEDRDPVDVALGAKIREGRAHRSISQQQLAERLGVSAQQLAKYEAGKDRIRAAQLKRIAGVLRLSVAFFYGETRASEAGDGLDAEAVEFARALASIPDPVIRRRLTAFANAMREDLVAAEDRIRRELAEQLARKR